MVLSFGCSLNEVNYKAFVTNELVRHELVQMSIFFFATSTIYYAVPNFLSALLLQTLVNSQVNGASFILST